MNTVPTETGTIKQCLPEGRTRYFIAHEEVSKNVYAAFQSARTQSPSDRVTDRCPHGRGMGNL